MENSSLSKVARLVLNRQLVEEDQIVVSCDAHTESSYVFAADVHSGEIKMDRNIHGGVRQVAKAMMKIGSAQSMVILYEAGNLGFSLYRHLTQQGYRCKVIAPNSIPRKPGKKTDRNDAIGNFDYYCSGLLRFVWVPDAAVECARECLRYRFELVWQRTAEKQKIQALLKRQGVEYTATKSPWTKKHFVWLKEVALPPEVRTVLDIQLDRIAGHEENIAKLDKRLMAVINANERFARLYHAYLAMTGIGPLGAMTWVFEGHDLNRFAHPTHLMSYLGIVPRKDSSGGKNPALSITKTGNAYLRYVTVCAARCYADRRLTQRKEEIKKHPAPLADLIQNCQSRLCCRYQHLRDNKKNGNKIKVAVARELCAFIWELAVKVLPQLDETQLKAA